MGSIYLPESASKARQRDAENARRNRAEIVRELSWGRVSRRDLLKWGLFTSAGLLAPIGGLNPFVRTAWADGDGIPRSPLFGAKPFTQPMPRFDVLERKTMDSMSPICMPEANTTPIKVPDELGGGWGPCEGRPPGPVWAHQQFDRFPPSIWVEATQAPAKTNTTYNPRVLPTLNSGIDPSAPIPVQFHPSMPIQLPTSVWTFNGTIPPKLVMGRYGEPMLFRHHNGLPADCKQNGGFGRHTISTHEHNGHHGAENDGFTGAYFFPGQFYDYHWPIVLAGQTMDTGAKAGTPDGNGGVTHIPGDWRETMSTHWFHDHMFSYTAQNVYKGNAAMFNIYSALDRGNEEIDDTNHVNLRLPSGTKADWGNLDYDVNLMLADKAWGPDGQLAFDIFNFDGFLGDVMTVNLAYKPFFQVERRKYRFRILNASVARFFKIALADASGRAQPFVQIANDGNLLPQPVPLMATDQMGIAERFDIIIDFSNFGLGDTLHLVNLCEHDDGRGPDGNLSMGEALSGSSSDPCVGRFLEFKIVRNPDKPDTSRIPEEMIPNPDLTNIPVARVRTFKFGRGGKQSGRYRETMGEGPWGISVDGGDKMDANYNRISAAPKFGTREVWHLVNDGGGWDHPIHIHFEEGQILARNGSFANVPLAERGRKDVYRLHEGGSVTITMQFRDWGGMFMEHCHNTSHEDSAMLLRWEINGGGDPFLKPLPAPIPTPHGVTFEDPE
jgi:FtsP/CotA-like multicopper oxidase with cupredoxin domain